MGKNRLEAFSDGVIAIIITIMVLELKVPHGASFNDLLPVLPVLGSYVLSFIYVGIYWNKLQYGCYPMFRDSSSAGLVDPVVSCPPNDRRSNRRRSLDFCYSSQRRMQAK